MFDRLKRKMRSPGEILNEANGTKALGNLALLHAYRENEARLAHLQSNSASESDLPEDELEDLKAEVEAGREQFGSDIGRNKLGLAARRGDQFHIPDVEPKETKAEAATESSEESEIESSEHKLAA
jgi:hypothetical protein